jgi:hypothetical protein
MKITKLITLFITTALLAACKPATETEAPTVAQPEMPESTVAQLPVRYSVIDLAGLDSPDAMTALCDEENKLMRDHMAALESF